MPHLPSEEWDQLVGRHLQLIEAGAEIAETHARLLFGMPEWETRAMVRVLETERLLGKALTHLVQARQQMERKRHVS
jgi:hypothetical protein